VLWLGRYDAVLAFDAARGQAFIAADDAAAARRFAARLDEGRARALPRAEVSAPEVDAPEAHERAIACALEHIARGDIYQVNLARRWRAAISGEPLALFLAMREASPVPLGAFVDAGDHAVLARTMERFLHWDRSSRELSTRPIKGTIARAGDDAAEAQSLAADDKERAEHAMIVDLMRNDLGRVAETGSVIVDAPMVVEPYAKLSHLVSTVRCTTREDVTLEDVVRATFPPGSVTGAPKVRAIEIIEALEAHPRGAYTGCIGLVDRAGGARFAVAIRTAEVRAGEVVYHAGGGLVSASVPAREVAETELKARAFLDAIAALARR
jgi:anthranilate/para-aminobenzoate synthase component I